MAYVNKIRVLLDQVVFYILEAPKVANVTARREINHGGLTLNGYLNLEARRLSDIFTPNTLDGIRKMEDPRIRAVAINAVCGELYQTFPIIESFDEFYRKEIYAIVMRAFGIEV